MSYEPQFTITNKLLNEVELISALRERIGAAAVELAWIPALQKDSRARTVHASTAIEGNPLTLEQVKAIEAGKPLAGGARRANLEVENYFAGLRFVEKHATKKKIGHADVLELHKILADKVMDQGTAGRYRTIAVQVGRYKPPPAADVSGLMFELLEWWNIESRELSPVLSSAVLHFRFEAIHPFADGNGRTGRALALWELYRRGFDTHHIFSIDEYFWENRPRYYEELDAVRKRGDDLTGWLEYCAEGLKKTLENVWLRIQSLHVGPESKIILSPKQERLLNLLRDHDGMAPSEIWKSLDISRQGAMDLLNPLIASGIVQRVGGKKTGHYKLRNP